MIRFVTAIQALLVLQCIPLPAFSQENGVSKAMALDALRKSLSFYDRVDLRASARTGLSDDGHAAGVSIKTIEVKRLGSQALISVKEVVERPETQAWRQQQEFLTYSNGDVLRAQAKLDSGLGQIDGRGGLALGLHSKRLAGVQPLDAESVYSVLNDAGAAMWVVGYAPLLTYLNSASAISITRAGGQFEIAARGEYGHLTLTTSASSGWLPESFTVIKKPEHRTNNGLVAQVYGDSAQAVIWTGKADGFAIASAGRWAPGSIDIQRRTEWKEKPVEFQNTTVTFDHVIFDPALTPADFHTSIVAPDGFPVDIIGAENLPYKWHDGKVIPGIPERPLPAHRTDFKELAQHASSSRTLMMLAALNGLFVVISVAIIWRRRIRRAGALRGE